MNYIRQLNAFEKWLDENKLSNSADLLMRKILGISNRRGWPDWVAIENLELMAVMRTKREATVTAWRDELLDKGLIRYKKGKKGTPNRYKITILYEINTTVNDDSSVAQRVVESVVKSGVKSVAETVVLSKHKQKQKRDNPPISPQGVPGDFSEPVRAALVDWLQYKAERKEAYKPTGLSKFYSLVRNKVAAHGAQAVADVIGLSMANNWRGVIWEKIANDGGPKNGDKNEAGQTFWNGRWVTT